MLMGYPNILGQCREVQHFGTTLGRLGIAVFGLQISGHLQLKGRDRLDGFGNGLWDTE